MEEKNECKHEYEPVTKDYPILSMPIITEQKLTEYVCKKCGHVRATAITKLLEDGYCHGSVKDFSGHASVQMIELYDKRKNTIARSVGKNLQYH